MVLLLLLFIDIFSTSCCCYCCCCCCCCCCCLPIPSQRDGIVFFPITTSRRSNHIVVSVTLSHSSVLPTRCRETSQLTVLVDSLADPVDTRISTDGFVHGINHDDFVVHVCGILADPIRTQHSKSSSQTTGSFFSFGTNATLKFDLVDSLTFWFTISCTLRYRLLTATTTQTDTVDDISLLGSVPQSSSFIRTSGSRSSMDGCKMTKLPTSNSEQETKKITLFLFVQLLQVFVSTHLDLGGNRTLISVTICSSIFFICPH